MSIGCLAMWGAWASALGLIVGGWLFDQSSMGQGGLGLSAAAAALAVIRDNNRTRRMISATERRRSGGDTVTRMR